MLISRQQDERHFGKDERRSFVSVIESFNEVVEIARSLGHAELKRALRAVREELKVLLDEMKELREQNRELLTRLEAEGKTIAPKRSVKFEHGTYWQVDDAGIMRGPMCAKCWESRQELHRCMKQMQYFFMCSKCGAVARLPGVKPA